MTPASSALFSRHFEVCAGLGDLLTRATMTLPLHIEKRDTMLKLLDRGLVMVHLDPRVEGVVVPEWLQSDPTLRLNIAYGFNLPALEIDEEGIYAVLSFGGQNYGCTLPWPAVFALTLPQEQHEGQVWPESLPSELVETMTAVEAQAMRDEEAKPLERPALRVVSSEQEADEQAQASEPEAPSAASEEASKPSTGRAKLRLVTD